MQTMAYMLRGATVHGSIGNIGGLDPVIALQAGGRIDLRPMVTARYDLEHAVEAVERAFGEQASDGAIELPGVMSRKKQVAPKIMGA